MNVKIYDSFGWMSGGKIGQPVINTILPLIHCNLPNTEINTSKVKNQKTDYMAYFLLKVSMEKYGITENY